MYTNFAKLPQDKQEMIIQVALEEFANLGYTQASTNTIIKKAGISKGILFHYFGSKKNLFLYLIDYATGILQKSFDQLVDKVSSDIFERLIEMSLVKLKIFQQHPVLYRFLMENYGDMPPDIKMEIAKRHAALAKQNYRLIYDGIDYSSFREDLDRDKSLEFVFLALKAYSDKYIESFKFQPDKGLAELEEVNQQLRSYMEMIRFGVYKRSNN